MAKIIMAIKNINVKYVSGNLLLFLLNLLGSRRGKLNAQSVAKLLLFTMTINTIPSIAVVIKSAIMLFILLNLISWEMLPVKIFSVKQISNA